MEIKLTVFMFFLPLCPKYNFPASVLNRVHNFLGVCPSYKQDEIGLYSK